MNVFTLLAILALIATIVALMRGIASMTRGGESDERAGIQWMFRRVEFQAAALGLILAAGLLAAGQFGPAQPGEPSVAVNLGVLPASVIAERYGPGSAEAKAYGGLRKESDSYLVTVAVTDPQSGHRIDDADVSATVGRIGLSGTEKALQPASFGGATTYGNYFRMGRPGMYTVDVAIHRQGRAGTDRIQLKYQLSP